MSEGTGFDVAMQIDHYLSLIEHYKKENDNWTDKISKLRQVIYNA